MMPQHSVYIYIK